jgi:hypothetical protein
MVHRQAIIGQRVRSRPSSDSASSASQADVGMPRIQKERSMMTYKKRLLQSHKHVMTHVFM